MDTNERGFVQDFVEDFPALGWGKMSERSTRGKIEMVCITSRNFYEMLNSPKMRVFKKFLCDCDNS